MNFSLCVVFSFTAVCVADKVHANHAAKSLARGAPSNSAAAGKLGIDRQPDKGEARGEALHFHYLGDASTCTFDPEFNCRLIEPTVIVIIIVIVIVIVIVIKGVDS